MDVWGKFYASSDTKKNYLTYLFKCRKLSTHIYIFQTKEWCS